MTGAPESLRVFVAPGRCLLIAGPGDITSESSEAIVNAANSSLMGAQAVLNSVKADISKLPPEAKPALHQAIASYNLAEAAWQAYHGGKSDDQAALTKAISQATGDVATLLTQISGGKK